jgi:hypothetical protein
MKRSNKHRYLNASCLVLLGILSRTVFHFGPNVEYVTTASLLAGSYLGKKFAIIIPLIIMAITDLWLGNSNIFVFTWSAYAVIGVGGYYTNKFKTNNLKLKITKAVTSGIIAGVWFYLWTNFGVWLLDSWGMYPKTVGGLIDAYIMGLPFLKYNLLGNLFFIPISYLSIDLLKAIESKFSFAEEVKI